MRLSSAIACCVYTMLVALAGESAAQPRQVAPTTHECFLYSTSCGSTVDGEITIFGCRYVSSNDTKYWTRYRFFLSGQADVTASVTSTEFIPEIGISEAEADVYTKFESNANRRNTVAVSARMPSGAAVDVDIYAKSPYTGRFRLTITCAACPAPVITQHPLSTSVPYGTRATLSVSAVGREPMRYAWFDASNPNFAIGANQQFETPPITSPAAYFAQVFNECGEARTLSAIVEPGACDRPSIQVPVTAVTVARGAPVSLDVIPSGTGPLSIQWYEGSPPDTSRPVGTAGVARLSIPSVMHPTSYWARVSNGCGFTESMAIRVNVTGTARRRSVRR